MGASGPGPSPCHRFDALWSDGEDGDGVIGVGTKRCGWDRNRLEDDDSLWSSTIVREVEVVVAVGGGAFCPFFHLVLPNISLSPNE